MKPATSALHEWAKVLFTNREFRTSQSIHLNNDNCGSTHYNMYVFKNTTVPDYNYHRDDHVVTIILNNTGTNKINVGLRIASPTVLQKIETEPEKHYGNLKLKDVIAFMKMYNSNYAPNRKRTYSMMGIYYVNPNDLGGCDAAKEWMERNPKLYNEYKAMVEGCFGFLDKREAQNKRMKAKDSDF